MPEAIDSLTDALLASALRGGALPPPRAEWPALLASAGEHGVLPLLADAAAVARWDVDLLAAMRPSVAAETALAMLREPELRRVLSSLAAAGVTPLLLKGAHLAFTVYPTPDRRPRLDTDLLVREGDRGALKECLAALGYGPGPFVTGRISGVHAVQYRRVDESGASHTLDIHWRIAIPKVFAERLTYDDLRRDAVAVPRLGPHALAPSPPLALVVSCLHRTAHHGTSTRLLWLYDIHLLAAALSEPDWDVVVEQRPVIRHLAPVVRAGLEHATARLGTPVPPSVHERLRRWRRRNRARRAPVPPRHATTDAGRPLRLAPHHWRRARACASSRSTSFRPPATCATATASRRAPRCHSSTCIGR